MEFGLNLYSVRTLLKDGDGIIALFKRLKAMGYSYVQFSGAAMDAAVLERAVKESGMPIKLTHASPERILNDTDNLVKEHLEFGCRDVGLGCMPQKYRGSAEGYRQFARDYIPAAKKIEDMGLKFHYHNHAFEFIKYGGLNAFDYLLENARGFNFILDTYWLQAGGVSITEYAEKAAGRSEFVHLKDYVAVENGCRIGHLGEGNINFPAVVGKMKECGTEYFLVEQDDAVDYPLPLAEIEASARYLNGEAFK